MFVKPAQDRIVPDPQRGDTLPAEGREVEPNQYWTRRIADGDAIRSTKEEHHAHKKKEG